MSKETQNESYMSPFKATILQNSLIYLFEVGYM
jgi:hypothetical protein